MLTGAFKGFGISKIQRLQGTRDEGFQGSKVQGLEGERAYRLSWIQRFKGSKGLKGLSKKFHGEGIGRPIFPIT